MSHDELKKLLTSQYRFGAEFFEVGVRARFKCEYCDKDLLVSVDVYEFHWEREHVVPSARGGADEFENLAFSCRTCNQLKRDWNPAEAAPADAIRDDLVRIARDYIQALRAERQTELAEVRRLIQAEIAL